ncbi:uncharacterized protein MONBRDRAFT_24160 [Monosiga brevicollis MX1]|uniref:Uncharacterized protein n=1 Tax=Monosiga brevicollis TaxID=81824 RepID=A9UVK1_MONBE|nr:uncharacterized protein MONBRDRAFT_24160 [Monosiga brevicollis MX1]EDQ90411.1 predicted protein [Monosiga brevicollis MX1]|eukprot:XP_001744462.1 hypothetical protein [Monosiga brevicollis MX1]
MADSDSHAFASQLETLLGPAALAVNLVHESLNERRARYDQTSWADLDADAATALAEVMADDAKVGAYSPEPDRHLVPLLRLATAALRVETVETRNRLHYALARLLKFAARRQPPEQDKPTRVRSWDLLISALCPCLAALVSSLESNAASALLTWSAWTKWTTTLTVLIPTLMGLPNANAATSLVSADRLCCLLLRELLALPTPDSSLAQRPAKQAKRLALPTSSNSAPAASHPDIERARATCCRRLQQLALTAWHQPAILPLPETASTLAQHLGLTRLKPPLNGTHVDTRSPLARVASLLEDFVVEDDRLVALTMTLLALPTSLASRHGRTAIPAPLIGLLFLRALSYDGAGIYELALADPIDFLPCLLAVVKALGQMTLSLATQPELQATVNVARARHTMIRMYQLMLRSSGGQAGFDPTPLLRRTETAIAALVGSEETIATHQCD